jgi:DNA-directed RNA polymerase delta subunit
MNNYLLTDEEIKLIDDSIPDYSNDIEVFKAIAKSQIKKLIDMAVKEGYIALFNDGEVITVGDSQWGFFNKLLESIKEEIK